MVYKICKLDEIVDGNPSLVKSSNRSSKRDLFYNEIDVLSIKELVNKGIIYRLFKKAFITKERAIKIIEKETGYGYDYVKEVIKYFNEWPQMFISSNNFENKKKVEKKIMKSLGYKLKKRKWIIE